MDPGVGFDCCGVRERHAHQLHVPFRTTAGARKAWQAAGRELSASNRTRTRNRLVLRN